MLVKAKPIVSPNPSQERVANTVADLLSQICLNPPGEVRQPDVEIFSSLVLQYSKLIKDSADKFDTLGLLANAIGQNPGMDEHLVPFCSAAFGVILDDIVESLSIYLGQKVVFDLSHEIVRICREEKDVRSDEAVSQELSRIFMYVMNQFEALKEDQIEKFAGLVESQLSGASLRNDFDNKKAGVIDEHRELLHSKFDHWRQVVKLMINGDTLRDY